MKKNSAIPQLGAVPSFSEEPGYKEMIDELVADRKACASDAVTACSIEPDDESLNAEFGLGKILEGVTSGFDDLLSSNETIEVQAIDKINADTNKKID